MKRMIFATCLAAVLVSLATAGFTSRQAKAEIQKVIGSEPMDQFVPGRVLVKFHDEVLPDQARNIIGALGARDAGEIPNIGVHLLELPSQAREMAFVHAFREWPEVEFAELDQLLSLAQQVIPNDPFYDNPSAWSLQKIHGPDAWAINTGSITIVIAILDSGVDGTHEDLAAKMVPGWNIYNNNADTSDVNGHGTAVAGTAAAASNNGLGVASVAWGCRIMPVRIADSSGYASVSDIASGLSWAADHGARVANISFNATGYSTVSSGAKYFQNKGGVVAVAAGNDGTAVQTADDPYLLTVGATDQSDALYSWSNSGKDIDVVAPGNVATTSRGGGYVTGTGTSFAAPIVAGAAALVLSANPALTGSEVQNIIKQSADDLGTTGWDPTYGYGRINLASALNMSSGSGGTGDTTAPSIIITSPADGSTVAGMVGVLVSAVDNVGTVKVELYVDGIRYGTSSNFPFTIKWNTRKAARGGHTLQAKAYDAAGNVGVSPANTVYK
jgi:thermitase